MRDEADIAETREEVKQRKARARLDYARAYAAVFAGSRGQALLDDLKALFGYDKPSAVPGISNETVWLREGMKQPVRHIVAMVALAKRGGDEERKGARGRRKRGLGGELVPAIPPEMEAGGGDDDLTGEAMTANQTEP